MENMTEFGAAFLLLVAGLGFLSWGRHTLKIKEVHLRLVSMRDKEPLRGRLAVLYFGYMVGGSGLLMLLSLVAALFSRDGSYLDVMFFLGMVMFLFGFFGAGIVEFFAPPDETKADDGSLQQAREWDESDPWKHTRKRKRYRTRRDAAKIARQPDPPEGQTRAMR